MSIEERLSKLEKIVYALINRIDKGKNYSDADKSGTMKMIGENAERIEASEEGLCDIDEAYDSRMADVEEALCEISEMMEG